jgi:hypothetical protein
MSFATGQLIVSNSVDREFQGIAGGIVSMITNYSWVSRCPPQPHYHLSAQHGTASPLSIVSQSFSFSWSTNGPSPSSNQPYRTLSELGNGARGRLRILFYPGREKLSLTPTIACPSAWGCRVL